MEKTLNQNTIKINGKNIYYETITVNPEKPTIVFLHDSLGCVTLWRDFPEKISDATGCNVLIYDRWGYGKSEAFDSPERKSDYLELEADFLNDFLEALNLNNIILLGHSDGGSIALLTASKYASKIKAIICEAPHIFVEEITLQGILIAVEAYENTNLPERLQKYHGDKVDFIFKAWTKTWTSDEFRNWNIEPFLKNITAPLLFIQGENDEYGSLDQMEKTIKQVSGESQKLIIKNIGHTPHKEAPQETTDATVEFINSLSL